MSLLRASQIIRRAEVFVDSSHGQRSESEEVRSNSESPPLAKLFKKIHKMNIYTTKGGLEPELSEQAKNSIIHDLCYFIAMARRSEPIVWAGGKAILIFSC